MWVAISLVTVTKVFTVLALLHTLQQGDITSAEASVHDFLPGFCPLDHDCATDPVTFAALASQMGGIVREPGGPCNGDASDCNVTTAAMTPWLNSQPLLWPPNVRPSYSNLGFALLGHAVAAATGDAPYETYLESLLARLGMIDSTFANTPQTLASLARGHRAGTYLTELGWSRPDGGMQSTAADMERFLHFLTGSIADATAEAVLSTPRRRWWALPRFVNPDGISGYGMPWELLSVNGKLIPTKWTAQSLEQSTYGSCAAVPIGTSHAHCYLACMQVRFD